MPTQEENNTLPIGSMLREYEILSVLGQGGFGITYKALDTHLDAIMVIKEYMPSEFASRSHNSTVTCISKNRDTFEWGKKRFLEEAKVVKKFDHISIVKVLNLFEMNGTAYFVMDFYEGETLEDYLLRYPKENFSQDEILSVMMPIIEGLKAVHQEGFLHRDIAPDNIFMRKTKPPILIDFGASRNALGTKSKSINTIVKHGYSPPEQYTSDSTQDATSDLYAISAVMYQMVTGVKPMESTHRQIQIFNSESDPIEDIVNKYQGKFEKSFLQTIQKGLNIRRKDRIGSIREYQEGLVGESVPPRPPKPTPTNNLLKILIVLMGFVLVGVVGYIVYDIPEPRREPTPIITSSVKEKKIEDSNLSKIEKLQKECSNNNFSKCNKLGDIYKDGEDIKVDYKESVKFYQKACDGENFSGCSNLGYMYEKGFYLSFDKLKAMQLYQKACDGDNAYGCLNLSWFYSTGTYVSKDKKKANDISQKSLKLYIEDCNNGDSLSCYQASLLYYQGIKVEEDYVKALEFATKACDGENNYGCNIIADIYHNGYGLKVNKLESSKFYKKSCMNNDSYACEKLIEMSENNESIITKNEIKYFFKNSCDNGNMATCSSLGDIYLYDENTSKAMELYEKSCMGGDIDICEKIAFTYSGYDGGFGYGIETNVSKSIPFATKACDGGKEKICDTTASLYSEGKRIEKNISKAIELYQKSCDLGNTQGCRNLADIYINEEGVKKNILKAVALYQKACDGNNKECNNLAVIYSKGKFLKQDKEKAVELYKKACDSGRNTIACINLGLKYSRGEGVSINTKKAIELFKISCLDRNNGDRACSELGYIYKNGENIKMDKSKAIFFYQEACKNNFGNSCYLFEELKSEAGDNMKYPLVVDTPWIKKSKISILNIAPKYQKWMMLKKGIYKIKVEKEGYHTKIIDIKLDKYVYKNVSLDIDKAKESKIYERTCDMGIANGCFALGIFYTEGTGGVALDNKKAFNYFKKACNGGDSSGCNWLGYMYKEGKGVNIDKKQAVKFYKKACNLGNTNACDKLK